MLALFTFIVCCALKAPWWVFVIGFLILMLEK